MLKPRSCSVLSERRGHETEHHRAMKRALARLWTLLGWMVLFEEQLCDVVAWKCRADGRMFILAIEAERSTRNIRNVTRNLSRRCDRVLVTVTDETLRIAFRRKLWSVLLHDLLVKVGVTTIKRIEQTITRLEKRPHDPR